MIFRPCHFNNMKSLKKMKKASKKCCVGDIWTVEKAGKENGAKRIIKWGTENTYEDNIKLVVLSTN